MTTKTTAKTKAKTAAKDTKAADEKKAAAKAKREKLAAEKAAAKAKRDEAKEAKRQEKIALAQAVETQMKERAEWAAQIRALRNQTGDEEGKSAWTHKALGLKFGVSAGVISQICRNMTYVDPNYTPRFDGHLDWSPELKAEISAKKANNRKAKTTA